jgi:hypothetical protein
MQNETINRGLSSSPSGSVTADTTISAKLTDATPTYTCQVTCNGRQVQSQDLVLTATSTAGAARAMPSRNLGRIEKYRF